MTKRRKISPSCDSIFVDAQTGECLPSPPSLAYYTSWSIIASIVASLITVLYVALGSQQLNHTALDLTLLPIALGFIANILAVPLAITYFFAFGLQTCDVRPSAHVHDFKKVQRTFLRPQLLLHIVPIYLGVICLCTLYLSKPAAWTNDNRWMVAFLSVLCVGVLQLVYLCTAYKKKRFLEKVKEVYRKVDIGSVGLLWVVIILVCCTFAFTFGF